MIHTLDSDDTLNTRLEISLTPRIISNLVMGLISRNEK